jgi:hypothetical protein
MGIRLMNNYAHVENGVVTNISLWDGVAEYNPGDGVAMVLADENTRVGGTYDGSFHYVEPPVPEPTAEEVAKQDRLASVKSKLEALGLTTEEVQDAFGI